MDDLRNSLTPQNTQQTIDPRDLSTRREGLQRALELVTTDYVTNLNSCPVLPMPEQMQEQMEDIAQWTRLYHMDMADAARPESSVPHAADQTHFPDLIGSPHQPWNIPFSA